MKKVTTFLFCILICNCFSQSTFRDQRAGLCFDSFEDYQQNKPINDVKFKGMSEYGLIVKIEKDGKTEECSASELPYYWLCNNEGVLMRVWDGRIYYVIIEGSMLYYAEVMETWYSYPYNTCDEMKAGSIYSDNSNTWILICCISINIFLGLIWLVNRRKTT